MSEQLINIKMMILERMRDLLCTNNLDELINTRISYDMIQRELDKYNIDSGDHDFNKYSPEPVSENSTLAKYKSTGHGKNKFNHVESYSIDRIVKPEMDFIGDEDRVYIDTKKNIEDIESFYSNNLNIDSITPQVNSVNTGENVLQSDTYSYYNDYSSYNE